MLGCYFAGFQGKKGPKLTKAEKARLKLEEEQRRLREEGCQISQNVLINAFKCPCSPLCLHHSKFDTLTNSFESFVFIQWKKYMQCSDIPDPAVQQDINTFISLWRDDPECSIKTLIEELEMLLREVTDANYIPKYQETLFHLQDMVYAKILNISMDILKVHRASNCIDTETGNMQAVMKDKNTTVCVWANLMRKSRFKCLTFEEVGMGFELTKQLAMSNIAVRVLHTSYDHLSTVSRMTHMEITVDEEPKETQEEVQEEQEEEPAQEQESEQIVEEEEPPARESEEAKLYSLTFRPAEVTPPPPEDDMMFYGEGVEAVDLRKYTPLGGVFYYELFHLPPQSHHVKGWEIRKISEARLKAFQYIPEKSNQTEDEEATCPLVGLSVRLPDTVVFLETPRVGRWDAEGKYWRTDGISDFSVKEHVSFKMDSFYPFVLMQHTYANFPFRSWELRPLGKDSRVICERVFFLSVFQGNQCMLQTDREVALTNLFGKWMSAPDLQQAMVKAGINVFVNEHTEKFVTSCRKVDPLREHVAYEQMALFASVCAFSWSKWNAQCGPEHLVIKVCEHQGLNPPPEDLWSLYLVAAQRFQKLEITETSEVFCADHHPDSEFHSTFIHMLQDNMSPEGISRTREAHFLFVDTVQSLFCATRPLMFC
uniref:Dynein axonemal intermediate chain 7 n=1 Tax=Hippocampus comes TaxID=109280 RepID=A0A3Q2XD27_HIPCM